MKNSSKRWNGRSRGGYYGYLFFIYLIKIFGVRLAYIFLVFIVPYFVVFAPKSTSAIWRYNIDILRYNYPESVWKIFQHYYTFGQTIIDKLAINAGLKLEYRFKFHHYDEFLSKLDSNTGVIMIGAHIGCWEIGSSFFGDYGKKINIVMHDGEASGVKEALGRDENSNMFNIIDVKQGDISSIILMKQALDNAEYLCFQGDRYINEESTLQHSFMGSMASFPRGVFEIASKFQVPIVFYWAIRGKGREYKFLFEILERDEKYSKEYILGKYVQALENIVIRNPQQWFNFYDFWKRTEA